MSFLIKLSFNSVDCHVLQFLYIFGLKNIDLAFLLLHMRVLLFKFQFFFNLLYFLSQLSFVLILLHSLNLILFFNLFCWLFSILQRMIGIFFSFFLFKSNNPGLLLFLTIFPFIFDLFLAIFAQIWNLNNVPFITEKINVLQNCLLSPYNLFDVSKPFEVLQY